MMTDLALAHPHVPAAEDAIFEELSQASSRLQIFTKIERGFGVVPVFEEGAALLRPGEVAVYREERPWESWKLTPGFYCMEKQRKQWETVPSERSKVIEREVVYARPFSRPGKTAEGAWEYMSLYSRVVRGVRRWARVEGPIFHWALPDMLLGPIVGIYVPNPIEMEC